MLEHEPVFAVYSFIYLRALVRVLKFIEIECAVAIDWARVDSLFPQLRTWRDNFEITTSECHEAAMLDVLYKIRPPNIVGQIAQPDRAAA